MGRERRRGSEGGEATKKPEKDGRQVYVYCCRDKTKGSDERKMKPHICGHNEQDGRNKEDKW